MKNKGLLKLPETWYVRITNENKSVLQEWHKLTIYDDSILVGYYKSTCINPTKGQ